MFKFVSTYYVILVYVYLVSADNIPTKRLCADKKCSGKISEGITVLNYASRGPRVLSFASGKKVTVYSKPANDKEGLWGVEINGKHGYMPKTHIREEKVLTHKSDLILVEDTEQIQTTKVTEDKLKLSPDPVQLGYEVVQGTTVYLGNEHTTTSPITEATVAPNNLNHEETGSSTLSKVKDEPSQPNSISSTTQNLETSGGSFLGNTFSLFIDTIQEGSELLLPKPEDTKNVDDSLDDDIVVEVEDDDNLATDDKNDGKQDENNIATNVDKSHSVNQMPKAEQVIHNSYSTNTPSRRYENEGFQTKNNNEQINNAVDEKTSFNSQQQGILKKELPQKHLSHPPHEKEEQLVVNMSVSPSSNKVNSEKVEQGLKLDQSKDEIDNQNIQIVKAEIGEQGPKLDKSKVKVDSGNVQFVGSEKFEERFNVYKLPNLSAASTNEPEAEILNEDIRPIQETEVEKSEKQQTITSNDVKNLAADKKSEYVPPNLTDLPHTKAQSTVNTPSNTKNESPQFSANVDDQPDGKTESDLNNTTSKKDDVLDDFKNHETGIPFQSTVPVEQEHDMLKIRSPAPFSPFYSQLAPSQSVHTSENKNSNIIGNENINNFAESVDSEILSDTEVKREVHHQATDSDSNGNTELSNSENLSADYRNVEKTNLVENTEAPRSEVNRKDDGVILSENDIAQSLVTEKHEDDITDKHVHDFDGLVSRSYSKDQGSCLAGFTESDCPYEDSVQSASDETPIENIANFDYFNLPIFTYEVFLVLVITAVTVVVFLWGYIYIDRSRKEGPLVAKINNLQKQFLVLKTENEFLSEKLTEVENDNVSKAKAFSDKIADNLKLQLAEAEKIRLSLELQIQNLEKELENSTEVGLELNRMLSEFLNSDNGSDTMISNIDQLQRQLVEQQGTINTYNETLSIKETENHELRLELEINHSRVNELQSELNKMALSLLKLEEDKEQLQSNYETDIVSLKEQLEKNETSFKSEIAKLSEELNQLKQKYDVSQRNLELKTNEYKLLKENINHFNNDNNNIDTLRSMFDTTSIKAELLQLRNENQLLSEQLQQETKRSSAFEKQAYLAMEDARTLKNKYDDADQHRMEAQTKLDILSNYFKEREAQLQKELNKQESMWIEKQGEATSTIERIKYMQEELQNYKAQYESLKQEIIAQEVEMKSQISVLEKKAHENWVAARQAERKLEDAKQEAAQLRNRLTLRERSLSEDKVQNRLISPLEQNGDLSLNDTGISLPLIYGTRDHLTTSPALPSLPPHFLPPPPGVPFMPPPLGGVPLPPPGFLPPPPSMIPGDHRPPPLGRMSSPPLNSRYSPDSRAYSPYSRNSPSPTSDDEYDRPVYRGYSPYNRDDRRDFSRPLPPSTNRNSIRNHRGTTHSSGSANSNESLEKINRHNSKV